MKWRGKSSGRELGLPSFSFIFILKTLHRKLLHTHTHSTAISLLLWIAPLTSDRKHPFLPVRSSLLPISFSWLTPVILRAGEVILSDLLPFLSMCNSRCLFTNRGCSLKCFVKPSHRLRSAWEKCFCGVVQNASAGKYSLICFVLSRCVCWMCRDEKVESAPSSLAN